MKHVVNWPVTLLAIEKTQSEFGKLLPQWTSSHKSRQSVGLKGHVWGDVQRACVLLPSPQSKHQVKNRPSFYAVVFCGLFVIHLFARKDQPAIERDKQVSAKGLDNTSTENGGILICTRKAEDL
jgi:hypothetical protein